ncbi:MAG: hypothetical protein LBG18_09480 [Mediterranea sp.]|jgi:chromosome segregation ATPase|nr:hypothetical protein [Mediterranea sp.]
MGKKFMLVATLVGVLSLGACVDDKESASVEKIRNAKAEQLLSIKALNEANAYSIRLLADADAALKKIEAELKAVEVARERVQLELDEIKRDSAKIELDKRKEGLALELKKQAATLEADLLDAQGKLVTAQQSYLDALQTADGQEKGRLQTLLKNYTDAAEELIKSENGLAGLKRELIQLEYGLVDAKTLKEQKIVEYNHQIAYCEAQKATYEKYLPIVDKAKAREDYDAARLEFEVLQDKAKESSQKLSQLTTEFSAVDGWLNGNAYLNKLQNVFMNQGYTYGVTISYKYVNGKYVEGIYVDEVRYYGYEETNTFGISTWIPMFNTKESNPIPADIIYDDQSYGGKAPYKTITGYYPVQKDGFDSYIAAYKEYIEDNQQENYDDAKEAYDDAKDDEEDAKKAAEKTGATDDVKAAYVAAHYATETAKSVLDNAEKELKAEQEKLAKVEEAYAFITSKEQTDAVKAKVDAYNKLSKEISDWTIQNAKDNYAVTLKSAERNALETIYYNAIDVAAEISFCDKQITYYKRQIEDASAIETAEELIESKKVAIANKEAEIEAKKIEVAKAKAAFEEAAAAANE